MVSEPSLKCQLGRPSRRGPGSLENNSFQTQSAQMELTIDAGGERMNPTPYQWVWGRQSYLLLSLVGSSC